MTTDEGAAPPAKSKTDRYIKLGFLTVTLLIVGYLIIHPHLTKSIDGWGNDFDEAMTEAEASGRRAVVLMYDSPQNHNYKKLRGIITKKANVEALDEADMVRVQVRLDRDDALAIKYNVTQFPTTLLLEANGTLVTSWEGYIAEVAFRSDFIKGNRQP